MVTFKAEAQKTTSAAPRLYSLGKKTTLWREWCGGLAAAPYAVSTHRPCRARWRTNRTACPYRATQMRLSVCVALSYRYTLMPGPTAWPVTKIPAAGAVSMAVLRE